MKQLKIILKERLNRNGVEYTTDYPIAGSSYDPTDASSIISAIHQTSKQIEEFEGKIEDSSILRIREGDEYDRRIVIRLTREDGTCINEYDTSNFKDTNQIITDMTLE